MKLILLGAPGAGKGTQAEILCEKLSIPAISTGNIIREAMRAGTQPGLKAKQFVESGGLVPDEIVIAMLKERMAEDDCGGGYILDGFPRTVSQAQALEKMGIIIDKVVNYDIDDSVIIERLTGRRVCQGCGVAYHVKTKPPKQPDKCDKCNADVVARTDDAPETVKNRLKVYHEQTKPLEEYYSSLGKLVTISAENTVDQINRLTLEAIK